MTTATLVKRTALYEEHRALGAKMIPFGGFDMPVQYGGILKEHEAVRHRAGLFDLSHMGQFEIVGPDVGEWADALTVNHVATMKPGQARYNIFCNERGGALDDVIFYRLSEDRWLLVVNASNADKMWAHINTHKTAGVTFTNNHGKNALIALQGPLSVKMLAPLIETPIESMKYYSCVETAVYGIPALVARTGYTGEDGFELFVAGDRATEIWHRLLDDYRESGLEAAGLGARDVLRLEAGMPLYGHEMTEEITPVQAGLAWAIKLAKPTFLGKGPLQAQLEADTAPRIAGLVLEGRAPAREGYPVLLKGARVGEIRSGSIGPSVGNKNIATALVEKDAAALGQTVQIEIRGALHDAQIAPLPFYKRSK